MFLALIDRKDVDGLHANNLGKLAKHVGLPCTPQGCMYLIEQTGVSSVLHAVVVGRGCIVGKPIAQVLRLPMRR